MRNKVKNDREYKELFNKKLNYFHGELARGAVFKGDWDIPYVESNGVIPTKVIPFSKAMTTKDYDCWVVFYEDDFKFERIWNNPQRYLQTLKKFEGVVGPDYSLYGDYPLAVQIYNTYRSRLLTHWFKMNGIKVVPNVRWSTSYTYSFCFDGLKRNDIVFVGSHGCSKRKGDKALLVEGLKAMVQRISPNVICVYGKTSLPIFEELRNKGISIISFESECSCVHRGN